jgi:hypothetical protein
MATGARNITTTGQIGDGRDAAGVEYVLKHACAGDIDDVLATISHLIAAAEALSAHADGPRPRLRAVRAR